MAAGGAVLVLSLVLCACSAQRSTNETAAETFLEENNAMSQEAHADYYRASWAFSTNITDHNQAKSVEASGRLAQFRKETYNNATQFDWSGFRNATTKRLFDKITDIGTAVLPPDRVTRVNQLGSELSKIYSSARVCNKPGQQPNRCYPLDPDLTRIMAQSRDWDELTWAWQGWRNVTGREMKDKYEEFIRLQNEAARMNNFTDMGASWRANYETENFTELCETLWNQVKPLYQNLHAYVRRKLMEKYKGRHFPDTRHIPAHILGNMWAQNWQNVMDITKPFNKSSVDVSDKMRDLGYNATTMFLRSEEFFTSLGMQPMPDSFWRDSMITKPPDRQVVCHASAWDFRNQRDFRIKQCTEVTMDWLMTTHHEMGHVEYFLEYKQQPVAFRGGANPGFHEAIGDVMSLSVSTPDHLHKIGLLDRVENDNEADLNFLFRQALSKVAFLPFGYLIDQWRWSVFRGDTTKADYNKKWWELRCKYQGVSPPVDRTEEDFDPGAKNHVPGNTPYIRYFISNIIQFQFHKALCDAAGYNGPLHRCSIYNSTDAGNRLRSMLQLGSSEKWPVAMQRIAGIPRMDAKPLADYFEPLTNWLRQQNEGHNITWDENCPTSVTPPVSSVTPPRATSVRPPGSSASQFMASFMCIYLAMILYLS